jgi:hypothetical protein
MENNKMPGYEVVCKAEDCAYNDMPICLRHFQDEPIYIAPGGRCIKYAPKD